MKIPNKRVLQQIAFDHSSDFGFKEFLNPLTKYTASPCSVLDIDVTIVSDNSWSFRKNLLEKIWKLIMTINDKIRNEKLEYDFNREIATKLPLLSDKIDKYEYLTVDEILPPSHKIVM